MDVLGLDGERVAAGGGDPCGLGEQAEDAGIAFAGFGEQVGGGRVEDFALDTFGVGAAVVGDGDFVDACAGAGDLGDDLGLDAEAVFFEGDGLDQFAFENFVAGFHVGEVEIGRHVRDEFVFTAEKSSSGFCLSNERRHYACNAHLERCDFHPKITKNGQFDVESKCYETVT